MYVGKYVGIGLPPHAPWVKNVPTCEMADAPGYLGYDLGINGLNRLCPGNLRKSVSKLIAARATVRRKVVA